MALAGCTGLAEVLTAGHAGELVQLAGIPAAQSFSLGQRHVHLVHDVEAVAGGADVGARPAGEASLPQFRPEGMVVGSAQQGRQFGRIEVETVGEARPLGAEHPVQTADVGIGSLASDPIAGEELFPSLGRHVHRVSRPQVGQVQVVPFASGQRPHALAEGMFVARLQALQADDDGLPPPLQIVSIGVVLGKDLIQ